MKTRGNRLSVAISLVLVAILSGGIAAAVNNEPQPTPGGFKVCVSRASGQVRAVNGPTECKAGEFFTEVKDGAPGADGKNGLNGVDGVNGLDGKSIVAGDCHDATFMVGVAQDGNILCSTSNWFDVPDQIELVEGGSEPFAPPLQFRPQAETKILVTSSDPSIVLVNGAESATVVLTYDNWTAPPTIQLTSPHDDDVVWPDDAFLELRHIDPVSAAATVPTESVRVRVTEDDRQDLIVGSAESVEIHEGGEGHRFPVRLAFKPEFDEEIVSVRCDDVDCSVNRLVFTTDNYNVDQYVSITAPADANTRDSFGNVLLQAGIAFQHIDVTAIDDDVQEILVSTLNLVVREGEPATLTARLRYDPEWDYDTYFSCSDEIQCPGAGPITFDSTNWDSGIPIQVIAPEDNDALDTDAIVFLDNPYGDPIVVYVTVLDND